MTVWIIIFVTHVGYIGQASALNFTTQAGCEYVKRELQEKRTMPLQCVHVVRPVQWGKIE